MCLFKALSEALWLSLTCILKAYVFVMLQTTLLIITLQHKIKADKRRDVFRTEYVSKDKDRDQAILVNERELMWKVNWDRIWVCEEEYCKNKIVNIVMNAIWLSSIHHLCMLSRNVFYSVPARIRGILTCLLEDFTSLLASYFLLSFVCLFSLI